MSIPLPRMLRRVGTDGEVIHIKARYTRPETAMQKEYKKRLRAYTRGCMAAAQVLTLYKEFGFGQKTRIPRFIDEVRRRVQELDRLFGEDEHMKILTMHERLAAKNIEYGKRKLSGMREYSADIHDTMTAVALEVLADLFRFGIKRTDDGAHGTESRLDKFFTALGKEIKHINTINEGIYDNNNKFIIMFDEWLSDHLISYGFSYDFVKEKIMKW